MNPWPKGIGAITLFVEDLAAPCAELDRHGSTVKNGPIAPAEAEER